MEEIQKLIQIQNARRVARTTLPFIDNVLSKGGPGGAAQEGEVRTWNGRKMRKQGGKWVPVGPERKKAPESGKKDKSKKKEEGKPGKGGPNDPDAMMKPKEKLKIPSHEMGQLKRIKELIAKKDFDGANDLAADLGEEAKNVIPADAWSKMHERTSPTDKATKDDVNEKVASEDKKGRLKAFADKHKDLFDTGEHAHPTRSKASKWLRGKAKGFVKGLKHEIEHIKEAGSALKKIFTGKHKEMTHHEKKALKKVGISLGLTVATMLATGGLSAFSHGFASTATHLGVHFVEHGLIENAGLAAIFAKGEEDGEMGDEPVSDKDMDMMLERLSDMFFDFIEKGDWKAAMNTDTEE